MDGLRPPDPTPVSRLRTSACLPEGHDDPAEATDFLGADEDGRAPAGSFGARIQLAYLVGLISKKAVGSLRAIKALRNVMAHRVNADILGEKAQKALEPLRADLLAPCEDPRIAEVFRKVASLSRADEEAARMLVLFLFSVLHDVLHETAQHLERVAQGEIE